jgi:hypothetical protein
MSIVPIFKNEFITVEYWSDKATIYHVVHKPIADTELREALNAGVEALQKYGICKWVSDDRKNGPLSSDQMQWAFNDWNPRAIAAGWKYWANVVPEELSAAATLNPLIDALFGMGLRMMVFVDQDSAIQWIDSLDC